ncbi:head-tail connector protein [Rhodobacter capsulatus]|uniref:head-tail connector protein n=1 Tax=Rhodobacter capsulatus TaxID=1061 RepID=UPI0003D3762F|nr:hypothetical protein [Rhodobacter capsulatus]ETD86347.1 hypothetical protein U703_00335 [Rhodobacter capsulatus YW1]
MRVLGPVPAAVSLAEFKRATHMDEGTEDDAALAACLAAAQSLVEQATNRPLGPREVGITLEAVPGLRRWWFPCAPVLSVAQVVVETETGAQALDPARWRLRLAHDEPQIDFAAGALPSIAAPCPVTITATVGADPESPALLPLRQAIVLIARDWHAAGITIAGEAASPGALSFGARAMLRHARYLRPRVMACGLSGG